MGLNNPWVGRAGNGITVTRETIATDEAYAHQWTGEHTFQATGHYSHVLPRTTDTFDLGSSTLMWRKAYISEIDAVLFAEQTVSLVGGWFVIGHDQGTLAADVAAANTTIDFGKTMTVGDFVLFRAALKVEYVQVGTLVSGTTYNVTRNLDGTGANDWPAGTPFLTLGTTGNGRVELNAYDTPRISLIQQGATYNAQTEVARLGDLNGNWGYAAATYGVALGEYGAGKTSITVDPTNGIRIRNNTTQVAQWAADGSITIGQVAANQSNVLISAGKVALRNNTTEKIVLNANGSASFEGVIGIGAAGGIFQGTGTFASPTTALKVYNSGGVGLLEMWGGGTKQIYMGTDGKLYAAGGNVALGSTGIAITLAASSSADRAYSFVASGNYTVGYLSGYVGGSEPTRTGWAGIEVFPEGIGSYTNAYLIALGELNMGGTKADVIFNLSTSTQLATLIASEPRLLGCRLSFDNNGNHYLYEDVLGAIHSTTAFGVDGTIQGGYASLGGFGLAPSATTGLQVRLPNSANLNTTRVGAAFYHGHHRDDAAFTGVVAGASSNPSVATANTQNWSHATGLRGLSVTPSIADEATGTITGVVGAYFGCTLGVATAAATVTNWYAVYCAAPVVAAGGTLSNRYSLYAPQNAGKAVVYDGINVGTATGAAAGQVDVSEHYEVDGVKVVGNQGAHVANATDAASVIARFNELLTRLEAHGLVASA